MAQTVTCPNYGCGEQAKLGDIAKFDHRNQPLGGPPRFPDILHLMCPKCRIHFGPSPFSAPSQFSSEEGG